MQHEAYAPTKYRISNASVASCSGASKQKQNKEADVALPSLIEVAKRIV
jgi:hypothetical protein